MNSNTIYIFTTIDRPREYTDDLKTNIESDMQATVTIANLEDVRFYVRNNKVELYVDEKLLNNIDTCYIKHWHANPEAANILSIYLENAGVNVFPSEVKKIVPTTKFAETFLLAMNELPVPDSVYFNSNQTFVERFEEIVGTLSLPFIFKAIDGKKGSHNYLIDSKVMLETVLEQASDHRFIAQKYIDNDGDYRIINFGNELKIAIFRTRSGETHLNNTSLGGDGELVPLESISEEIKKDCVSAVKLLGREISGIDVVIGRDNKHYFFEVNYSPQLTTGTYLEEKRKYLNDYLSNKS